MEKICGKFGVIMILGIDEVGAGSWAGPLSVCGVLYPSPFLCYVNDSKKLSIKQRNIIYETLIKLPHKVIHINSSSVDELGLARALTGAMREVILHFSEAEHIFIDGSEKAIDANITYVTQGDSKIPQISAASIIAKVEHDKIMDDIHEKYPQFNFIKNKGYGTLDHRKALELFGPTEYHRFSYKPIKELKELYDKKRFITTD